MGAQASPLLPGARFPSWGQAAPSARQAPIVIGLVNNMPDAALRATERQFCHLLAAASRDFVVRLKLFSFPEIERSPASRAHIAHYYDDFSELHDEPPDGLIVTGAEPRASRLEDEPCWAALSRLADWARDNAVPCVWSCLAAHAAVARMDGVQRRALGPKLSGVFECLIDSGRHAIVRGTPDRWRVPHSRMYGLSEDRLTARGYDILSWSAETGPDIFVNPGLDAWLFLQGHPEYGPTTLVGEYRRDVTRFLDGSRETYPDVPHGCFGAREQAGLSAFREQAVRERRSDLLPQLTTMLAEASPRSPWSPTAARIYANWILELDERRSQRARPYAQAQTAMNLHRAPADAAD